MTKNNKKLSESALLACDNVCRRFSYISFELAKRNIKASNEVIDGLVRSSYHDQVTEVADYISSSFHNNAAAVEKDIETLQSE